MTSAKASATTALLPPKGTYSPRKPTDIRSPCPAINALANHGYLPRDGRNVRGNDFYAGMGELGVAGMLAGFFSYPPLIERDEVGKPTTWWTMMTSPFSTAFKGFAMRKPGQLDKDGVAVINLDQLARPNCVEHDISLSRYDHQQGDNISPHPELIKHIMAASSDGKTINVADFVSLRKKRITKQRKDVPDVFYESMQHQIACTEIALILQVFGNGKEVPVSYVKAFFEEERLPREEGWTRRVWWKLGLIELGQLVSKVQTAVGDYGSSTVPAVVPVH
ncbi:MAG: hypothetical protein M1828_004182 [Chrysothrix sp. TS-e1954]|nr:MAG: hypothetical protein M1828_004182 [Chrysothrix sp. TS-e1954]